MDDNYFHYVTYTLRHLLYLTNKNNFYKTDNHIRDRCKLDAPITVRHHFHFMCIQPKAHFCRCNLYIIDSNIRVESETIKPTIAKQPIRHVNVVS